MIASLSGLLYFYHLIIYKMFCKLRVNKDDLCTYVCTLQALWSRAFVFHVLGQGKRNIWFCSFLSLWHAKVITACNSA